MKAEMLLTHVGQFDFVPSFSHGRREYTALNFLVGVNNMTAD